VTKFGSHKLMLSVKLTLDERVVVRRVADCVPEESESNKRFGVGWSKGKRRRQLTAYGEDDGPLDAIGWTVSWPRAGAPR